MPIQNLEETDKRLNELAFILSRNLVTNSFSLRDAEEPLADILNTEEHRTRNILVLGAGASHNACKDFLLAPDAAKKIGAAIKNKKVASEKLEELSRVAGYDPDAFETKLLSFIKDDDKNKKIVLKELDKLYNHKYPVSLFYEIVAHMFKHRFIDVIINFNFDEMLDNAIEEEMAGSQYKYIYSDGHCPENFKELLYENRRLAFPVYIKPHGTISHPSTLRFTRQAYEDTPSKIKDMLTFLIEGRTDYKSGQLHTNFIVAGFGLKSHEFNKTLNESMQKDRASLYYFDIYNPKNDHGNYWDRFKEDGITCFDADNSYLFPLENEDYNNWNLNEWFYDLWGKIDAQFKEPYKPKGIARHVIIHEVFNPTIPFLLDGSYRKEDFLLDKAKLEMAIDILGSNDGLINLRQLKESRVQKYFSEYKKENNNPNIQLFDLLQAFEMKKYKGYIRETWFYSGKKSNAALSIQLAFNNLVSEDLHNYFVHIKNVKRLEEHIEKLAKSRLFLNIRFMEKDNYISIFQKTRKDKIINTDIKWIYTFQKYFSKARRNEWNVIFSISETGGIFNTVQSLDDAKIFLICSYSSPFIDQNDSKLLKKQELLQGKLSRTKDNIVKNNHELELRMLPFRNHNQHVVLFAHIDEDSLKNGIDLVGGIYYSRRNMSKKVTPISIENADDLKELLSIFINYWERARKDDAVDVILKAVTDGSAVVGGQINEQIKNLAQSTSSRSFEDLQKEIIEIYLKDTQ